MLREERRVHKIRQRCGGDEGDEGRQGGAAQRQIKEQVVPRGRSETGFTCFCSPVTRFTLFPDNAAGPKLPKTSLIKVLTCATLSSVRMCVFVCACVHTR